MSNHQIRIQFSEQHRGPIPLDDFEDEGNADTRLDKDEDYRRLRAYLNQRQRLWETPPRWLKISVLSALGCACFLLIILIPTLGTAAARDPRLLEDAINPPVTSIPTSPGSTTGTVGASTTGTIVGPTYPPPFRYGNASVASDTPICSTAGVGILKLGGNAIDAAVATCLCLVINVLCRRSRSFFVDIPSHIFFSLSNSQGVASPYSSGLGGGGIMVIRLQSGQFDSFDFRETAPAAAWRDMYAANPSASTRGGLSIGVPGELRGLYTAWSTYGTLTWAQVVDPALRLARDGFPVHKRLAVALASNQARLMSDPLLSSVYFPNGMLPKEGDIIKFPKLAATLQRFANEGIDIFYNGDMAVAIVNEIQQAGGIITLSDLSSFTVLREKPLETYYHGYHIVGAAPPISGGAVSILVLNILERFNLPLLRTNGNYPLAIYWLQEAFKYGYADRMALGDPAFVNITDVVNMMLSKNHAAKLRENLRPDRTFPPNYYMDLTNEIGPAYEGGTTHLSVVDASRNAVSLTSTVNLEFGSLVMSNSTGILFNDQMDDFSSPNLTNAFGYPPSTANYIETLSSMTPTIVSKDGRLFMVVGASGGSRIITSTTWDISAAIYEPRIHGQLLPVELRYENGIPQAVLDKLTAVGNTLISVPNIGGVVQGITVDDYGSLFAASDPRKFGLPDGY